MTVGEAWGLVVNEAMACGLPIITTDKCVAGVELVRENENGYILAVGDDKGLSEKLEAIFTKACQEEMGKKSLEFIQSYTIENMAKTHIEVFERVLSGDGS
jgi:glycosyltransferase involved in cell wall biosynthesis